MVRGLLTQTTIAQQNCSYSHPPLPGPDLGPPLVHKRSPDGCPPQSHAITGYVCISVLCVPCVTKVQAAVQCALCAVCTTPHTCFKPLAQTAIAEGLALAIVNKRNPDGSPLPEFLHRKRILQLDVGLVIAGERVFSFFVFTPSAS